MRAPAALLLGLLALTAACRPGDRMYAVDADVAFDPRTGLEWTRRDHPDSLPWEAADRWCRELALGGRTEWRLPEIGELEAIYDPKLDGPCGDRACHLDAMIRLTGPYVWSVTSRGVGTRFYFDASYGTSFSPTLQPGLVRRAICVRTAR